MIHSQPSQGLLRPYTGILSEAFRVTDLALVFGSLYLATQIQSVNWGQHYTLAGLTSILFFLTCSRLFGLYGSWRINSVMRELSQVILVWFIVFFGLLLLAYSLKVSAVYSRRVVATWLLSAPLSLCLLRIAIRYTLRQVRITGRNMRTAAVIGGGEAARLLSETIETSPWMGVRLDGLYSFHTPAPQSGEVTQSPPVAGHYLELLNKSGNYRLDMIFVVPPADQHDPVEQIVTRFSDTTTQIYIVPNFFIMDLLHSRWGYIGDIPYLSLHESPFFGVAAATKRMEDVVLASIILAFVVLPMALIALGIKLTSSGPVLFKQRRYGINQEEIVVWKFRTMTVTQDGDKIPQATRGDPRVTPFGGFLRRTSLDELPQFINVLQGRMSIVGPRPHAVAHNELYRKKVYSYAVRHKIKPGITGWAQVNGWRGETDTLEKMEKRIEHDLWYIHNWSLLLDLKIMLLTIMRGWPGSNAY